MGDLFEEGREERVVDGTERAWKRGEIEREEGEERGGEKREKGRDDCLMGERGSGKKEMKRG